MDQDEWQRNDEVDRSYGGFSGSSSFKSKKKRNPFWEYAKKRNEEFKSAGENLTPVQLTSRVSPEWQVWQLLLTIMNNITMTAEERKNLGTKNNIRKPAAEELDPEVLKLEAEKYPNVDPKEAHIRNSFGGNVNDLKKRKIDRMLQERALRFQVMGALEVPDISTKRFVFANASVYVKKAATFHQSYPAEISIIAFSLKDGIVDMYHTFVDPGELAVEYTLEMFENKKKLNLPRTDYGRPEYQDYANIYQNIVTFLKRYSDPDGETYIYAMKEESFELGGSLNWLASKSNSNKMYTIYPLDFLVSQLSRQSAWAKLYREGSHTDPFVTITGFLTSRFVVHCITKNNPIVERAKTRELINYPPFLHPESAATDYMHSMNHAYDDFLACPHHRINQDGIECCPLLIVRKNAYLILDLVVLNFGIPPIPGRHYPYERNIRNVAATFEIGLIENVERNIKFNEMKPLPGYEPAPPKPPKAKFSYEKGIGGEISHMIAQQAETLAAMDFLPPPPMSLRDEEFMKSTESIGSTESLTSEGKIPSSSSHASTNDSSSEWEADLSDVEALSLSYKPNYESGALYRSRYNKKPTPFQIKHAERNRFKPMSGFRLAEPSSEEEDYESSSTMPQNSGNTSDAEDVLDNMLQNLEL